MKGLRKALIGTSIFLVSSAGGFFGDEVHNMVLGKFEQREVETRFEDGGVRRSIYEKRPFGQWKYSQGYKSVAGDSLLEFGESIEDFGRAAFYGGSSLGIFALSNYLGQKQRRKF